MGIRFFRQESGRRCGRDQGTPKPLNLTFFINASHQPRTFNLEYLTSVTPLPPAGFQFILEGSPEKQESLLRVGYPVYLWENPVPVPLRKAPDKLLGKSQQEGVPDISEIPFPLSLSFPIFVIHFQAVSIAESEEHPVCEWVLSGRAPQSHRYVLSLLPK